MDEQFQNLHDKIKKNENITEKICKKKYSLKGLDSRSFRYNINEKSFNNTQRKITHEIIPNESFKIPYKRKTTIAPNAIDNMHISTTEAINITKNNNNKKQYNTYKYNDEKIINNIEDHEKIIDDSITDEKEFMKLIESNVVKKEEDKAVINIKKKNNIKETKDDKSKEITQKKDNEIKNSMKTHSFYNTEILNIPKIDKISKKSNNEEQRTNVNGVLETSKNDQTIKKSDTEEITEHVIETIIINIPPKDTEESIDNISEKESPDVNDDSFKNESYAENKMKIEAETLQNTINNKFKEIEYLNIEKYNE